MTWRLWVFLLLLKAFCNSKDMPSLSFSPSISFTLCRHYWWCFGLNATWILRSVRRKRHILHKDCKKHCVIHIFFYFNQHVRMRKNLFYSWKNDCGNVGMYDLSSFSLTDFNRWLILAELIGIWQQQLYCFIITGAGIWPLRNAKLRYRKNCTHQKKNPVRKSSESGKKKYFWLFVQ